MADDSTVVSFGRRLADVARSRSQEQAVIVVAPDGTEMRYTWHELDHFSDRAAGLLRSQGAGESTMVVPCLPNGIEHFLVTFGAWKLGACVLPISPRLPGFERSQLLDLLGDQRLLVSRDLTEPAREGLELSRLPSLTAIDLTESAGLRAVTPHPGKAMGSGGSTGRPKIIVDPRPWVGDPGSVGLLSDVGFDRRQVQLVAGPLYHNAPFSASHYGLFHEHCLIVMERFDASLALELMERHRVSFAFLTPTMMLRMSRVETETAHDLSSLQAIYHTAMSCPEWLKREWIERLGPERIYEAYGATEAIGHTSIRGDEWLEHPGSVGRPQDCHIRILDSAGAQVGPGEIGEIYLRDASYPTPTYQYLGSDPLTQTPDGYSTVGDLGWMDADGYLYLADRRADLIVTGGVNVYPAEVEAVLTRHPDIYDAVVVGVPDPEWGHRVHAVVQRTDSGAEITPEALIEFVKNHLHAAKAPKSVEFVQHLPRDESGKVRRTALARERADKERNG